MCFILDNYIYMDCEKQSKKWGAFEFKSFHKAFESKVEKYLKNTEYFIKILY